MNDDIHPDEDTLERYVGGALSRAETVRVDRHMGPCRRCSRLLEQLHEVPVALEAAGEQYRQIRFQGDALALIRAHQAGQRRWTQYMRAAFLIPAAACIGFIVLQLLPLERPWNDSLNYDGSGGMDRLRFSRPHMPSSVSFSCTLPPRPAFSASDRPAFSFTIPTRPSGRVSAPAPEAFKSRKPESTKGAVS
jgi:hypothetical protein